MLEDSFANLAGDATSTEYCAVLRGRLWTEQSFDDSEVDEDYDLDDNALSAMANLIEGHLVQTGYSGCSVICHEDDGLVAVARNDADGEIIVFPGPYDSHHERLPCDSYTFAIGIEIEVELTVTPKDIVASKDLIEFDETDDELDDYVLTEAARTAMIEKLEQAIGDGGWGSSFDNMDAIEISVSPRLTQKEIQANEESAADAKAANDLNWSAWYAERAQHAEKSVGPQPTEGQNRANCREDTL